MSEDLREVFGRYGGVMKTSELREAGLYYKKIQNLLEQDKIEQIRRGYYQYTQENSFSEIPILKALFPDGVLCMESALDYYGYTDKTPSAWHLAIDSKTGRTRFHISYPIVKAHFLRTNRYLLGIEEVEIDGIIMRIYDRERTICDLLFHRNKLDAEIFNTAIHRYIAEQKKHEARLMKYAKLLRVEKKIKEVLGIWL